MLDSATSSPTPRPAREASSRARDLPAGLGDMDASLYLLFKAIRGHSTVALSGESADEVFGGYQQFFDPALAAGRHVPVAGAFRTSRRATGAAC